MRIPVTLATLLLWLSPLFALPPNAKSLLHDAAARYRNSKSFRLEFETTITSSSPYSHGWSKQLYAVAAADHKYHWEQKGSGLTGLRISDSQSDWFYRPGAHAYSVQCWYERRSSPPAGRDRLMTMKTVKRELSRSLTQEWIWTRRPIRRCSSSSRPRMPPSSTMPASQCRRP